MGLQCVEWTALPSRQAHSSCASMEDNNNNSANTAGAGNRVELANLLLPAAYFDAESVVAHGTAAAAAAGNGTSGSSDDPITGGGGGGGVVLLEARAETCADLLESASTQIQALVDLEKLSELVGVSRDDLVTDWHNQVSEQLKLNDNDHDHYNNNNNAADDDDNDDSARHLFLDAEVSERTMLLPQQQSPAAPHSVSDRVALAADAFVDTLTDVLEAHQATVTVGSDDLDDDEQDSCYMSVLADNNKDERIPVAPPTPIQDRSAQLHNHAFLLEMPTSTTATGSSDTVAGDQPHQLSHFILALPDSSQWDDTVSEASDASFLHGMTFLPSDVQDVHLEATTVLLPDTSFYNDATITQQQQLLLQQHAGCIRLDVVVKRQVPVIGHVILVTGLFALASVGAALNLQGHAVSPLLKTHWRLSSTTLLLLPLAARSALGNAAGGGGGGRLSLSSLQLLHPLWLPPLTATQWMLLAVCGLCYAFMTAAFVTALDLTTLSNAFVLSNLAPLFIIVGRWVVGLPVLYAEGLGATIGFLGGTICALDQQQSNEYFNNSGSGGGGASFVLTQHPHAATGNLLALLASAATAIYLTIAKKLRPHVDLFVFMFLIMFTASFVLLAYMLASGEDIRCFSNHPNYGLWGWTNLTADRLPMELYLAIVCNLLGTTSYIAVMKYFEPVVVSTVMLMEPVLAALMGAAAGFDPLPGLQTWIGDGIVTIGIVLVIWSGARTTETIDATEALLQVGGAETLPDDSMGGGVPLLNNPVVPKSPHIRSKPSPLARHIILE